VTCKGSTQGTQREHPSESAIWHIAMETTCMDIGHTETTMIGGVDSKLVTHRLPPSWWPKRPERARRRYSDITDRQDNLAWIHSPSSIAAIQYPQEQGTLDERRQQPGRPRASRRLCLFVSLLDHVGSAEATGSAGGDETDLLSVRRPPGDRRRVTNVLVVASSVGVLHGVHGHTSDLGSGGGGRM